MVKPSAILMKHAFLKMRLSFFLKKKQEKDFEVIFWQSLQAPGKESNVVLYLRFD